MKLAVLTAAEGAPWEAGLVVGLESGAFGVTVVRRCVDVVDLLAVAVAGQGRAALVAAGLKRLDADAVDRLVAAGVVPIGVLERIDAEAENRLRAMGVAHLVPGDARAEVVAAVIEQAMAEFDGRGTTARGSRTFGNPAGSTSTVIAPLGPNAAVIDGVDAGGRRGSVVAVWGPTGAPGRTTVAIALADELTRLGAAGLLIDADPYGGVIAPMLGLLDESPGFAAACRQAGNSRLGIAELAGLSWQLNPKLRVLTGIPRAQRWPELRPSAVENVLAAARQLADFTIVDCGFCLETDEELSYDTLAPRRNGVTLALLDHAELIIAVGSADPIGLQRLVRGLSELREAEVTAPIWVVLNQVRRKVVPGDPGAELSAALLRFAGRSPAALLPYDRTGLDEALAVGKTLGEVSPQGELSKAVRELAAAMTGLTAPSKRRLRRR